MDLDTATIRLRLERSLHKFTKEQLVEDVSELKIFGPLKRNRRSSSRWSSFSEQFQSDDDEPEDDDEGDEDQSKAIVVENLMARLKNIPEDDLLSHLDLFNWFDFDALDTGSIKETLKRRMKAYCSKVTVQMNGDAYWIRIALHSHRRRTTARSSTRKPDVVYAVYRNAALPSYVAISQLFKKHASVLLSALANSLGYRRSFANSALIDRSLPGLFQLAQDKDNLNFADEDHQIDHDGGAERPYPRLPDKFKDYRLRDLDENRFQERKDYNVRHFGAGQQPELRRLSYVLRAPFGGNEIVPERRKRSTAKGNGLFGCRVTFEGKSVIDGLRELVNAGIAEAPLPAYLANVRTLGSNHLRLKYTGPPYPQPRDDDSNDVAP